MAQPTKKTKLKQWPLQFLIQAKQLKARQIYKFRAGNLRLPHGTVQTPVFMPVATRGAFKGVTMKQVESIGFRLILGNTYHLQFHPGSSFIKQCQSLHGFVNWSHNMLTDSGGFQMVSLRKLSEVTEEGVKFQSPVDQTLMMLTPEKSIQIQNELGADIAMALDDVVQPNSERIVEAAHRTIRWLDRCIQAHNNPQQNLFGIIQGGVDQSLRKMCCEELVKRDLPGYAIGGLAGGEEKPDF